MVGHPEVDRRSGKSAGSGTISRLEAAGPPMLPLDPKRPTAKLTYRHAPDVPSSEAKIPILNPPPRQRAFAMAVHTQRHNSSPNNLNNLRALYARLRLAPCSLEIENTRRVPARSHKNGVLPRTFAGIPSTIR